MEVTADKSLRQRMQDFCERIVREVTNIPANNRAKVNWLPDEAKKILKMIKQEKEEANTKRD